jgi:uncharacterized membrane protein YdjX (TVP38/TMEM64 family)|tara:strand:+ start:195 stop:929 length:735 start_codon:yes stop_codon:yes gene_type:complete
MASGTKHKPTWFRYLPIIAIFMVTVVGFFTVGDYLNFDTLRDNHKVLIGFRDENFRITVIGFMTIYILIVGFSLPGATLATITGGFLFGTPWGVLINVTGATLGAVMIFLAVRMGFGEKLKARMDASEGKIRSIKNGIDENEWSMLFFLRLVPAVPFFVANLIPALLGVSLLRFVVSTFLGIIPGSFVFTSVGAGLGLVFARGETPDLDIIFEPHILLPILGLCILSLLPVLLKAMTGKKELLK